MFLKSGGGCYSCIRGCDLSYSCSRSDTLTQGDHAHGGQGAARSTEDGSDSSSRTEQFSASCPLKTTNADQHTVN